MTKDEADNFVDSGDALRVILFRNQDINPEEWLLTKAFDSAKNNWIVVAISKEDAEARITDQAIQLFKSGSALPPYPAHQTTDGTWTYGPAEV